MVTVLTIAGVIANRWNVTLSGLIVPLDWSPGVANLYAVDRCQPSPVAWGTKA